MLGHHDEPPASGAHVPLLVKTGSVEADMVIASDLRRASENAAAIASLRQLPLRLDRRWREIDFGAWDGAHPDAIDTIALQDFWADPDANPPPGGERWSDLKKRVGSAIDAIRKPAIVVTHAGAMRAAVSVLTGLDHRGVWAFDLPYGALLSLRIWRGSSIGAQSTGQITELWT